VIGKAFSEGTGLKIHEVQELCFDNVLMLFDRAIFTLKKTMKENPSNAVAVNIQSVMVKYANDAKLAIRYTILTLLRSIMEGPVDENIISPCTDLVQPVQDLIDSAPVPGLSQILNLTDLLSETISDILDSILCNTVDEVTSSSLSELDRMTFD
jgi:hypothetical protein